jgi:hypothetical protein
VTSTYFEDVVVDRIQETPAITVTEAHVAMYLGVTREADVPPGAVPEILPLCLSVGLGWRTKEPPMVVLAFVGLDWQIVREVRAGDTVHIRSRIASKRPMRDGGLVVEERELVDQRGDVAQQGKFTFLVAKRPKEVAA